MKLLGKLSPFRLLHRFLDRWTDANIAREKALVAEGAGAERRLWLRGLTRLVLSIAVLVGAQLLPAPGDTLAWGALGGLVGSTALIWFQRASAYRSGWLAGRQRMIEAITKTRDVDDLMAVIQHTAEYDVVHVLGLPSMVNVPDTPEDLE